ncbi:hypothetical protein BDB01DRAFT_852634 [Pilobolus umbonatus]|nr:hypothetical protein BDB01DRAFT_852634 [Pilobolus umbonatus]
MEDTDIKAEMQDIKASLRTTQTTLNKVLDLLVSHVCKGSLHCHLSQDSPDGHVKDDYILENESKVNDKLDKFGENIQDEYSESDIYTEEEELKDDESDGDLLRGEEFEVDMLEEEEDNRDMELDVKSVYRSQFYGDFSSDDDESLAEALRKVTGERFIPKLYEAASRREFIETGSMRISSRADLTAALKETAKVNGEELPTDKEIDRMHDRLHLIARELYSELMKEHITEGKIHHTLKSSNLAEWNEIDDDLKSIYANKLERRALIDKIDLTRCMNNWAALNLLFEASTRKASTTKEAIEKNLKIKENPISLVVKPSTSVVPPVKTRIPTEDVVYVYDSDTESITHYASESDTPKILADEIPSRASPALSMCSTTSSARMSRVSSANYFSSRKIKPRTPFFLSASEFSPVQKAKFNHSSSRTYSLASSSQTSSKRAASPSLSDTHSLSSSQPSVMAVIQAKKRRKVKSGISSSSSSIKSMVTSKIRKAMSEVKKS